MPDNLWPDDFGTTTITPPISILREQGRALGSRTGNIVVGRVIPLEAEPGRFSYRFDLWCAPLSYRIDLLTINHDIQMYPAEIVTALIHPADSVNKLQAANPEELTRHLRDIFARDATKRVIASLIAQSRQ
jgi:hypothetical protein